MIAMVALGKLPLLNDYSLCTDTVTVYHESGGTVTRTVHQRAYIEFGKKVDTSATGQTEANGFTLVIPGDSQAVRAGDKVMLGEGPQVPASNVMAWWRGFIPSKVDGLVVVKDVAARRWNGAIVHTEAGG